MLEHFITPKEITPISSLLSHPETTSLRCVCVDLPIRAFRAIGIAQYVVFLRLASITEVLYSEFNSVTA